MSERRVGVRAHVRVMGVAETAVSVENLSADFDSSFIVPFGSGDTSAQFTLVNEGNSRVSTHAVIEASGLFGLVSRQITTTPIADMLPGARVEINVELGDLLPAGWYRITVTPHILDSTGAESEHQEGSATVRILAISWPGLLLFIVIGLITWAAWRRRTTGDPEPRETEAVVG